VKGESDAGDQIRATGATSIRSLLPFHIQTSLQARSRPTLPARDARQANTWADILLMLTILQNSLVYLVRTQLVGSLSYMLGLILCEYI